MPLGKRGERVKERERERGGGNQFRERGGEGISFNCTVEYTSFCIIRPDRIQKIFMERERGGGERR